MTDSPDVGYITCPFLVQCIGSEILIQQVRRNIESMVAVGCGFIFAGSDNLYPILPHQAPYATVPDTQPQFLQLLGHPGPPIAL